MVMLTIVCSSLHFIHAYFWECIHWHGCNHMAVSSPWHHWSLVSMKHMAFIITLWFPLTSSKKIYKLYIITVSSFSSLSNKSWNYPPGICIPFEKSMCMQISPFLNLISYQSITTCFNMVTDYMEENRPRNPYIVMWGNRYLGHEWIITSHRINGGVITYPYSIHLLLEPKSPVVPLFTAILPENILVTSCWG